MKYYIKGIVCVAALIGCVWVFNHVNAWIGVAATLLAIGIGLNFLINIFKNSTK